MTENSAVTNLLHSFNPSGSALLDWLKPHIDDSHLDEIANADYGSMKEEYFQALKLIHETQQIPVPLPPWVPGEALSLNVWGEPDDPQQISPPPNSKGTRGHLIRAFCCAVLLKAVDEPESREYIYMKNETLIQLIGSVLHLGHEASESALRFLCWRALRLSHEEGDQVPFFAFALLLLSAALYEPHENGGDLALLADWVVDEEKRVRTEWWAIQKSEDWLLGLTHHDQRHEVWRKVAQEVLLDPDKAFPEPAATAMRNIVTRLSQRA